MTTPDPQQDWHYSGDPSASAKDEFRFLMQDTDETLKLLTDTEINYVLNNWMPLYGSVTYAASIGAEIVSRKFAGVASVSADGVTVNVAGVSDQYAKVASSLRSQYERESEATGEIDLGNLMVDSSPDPSIAPLRFGMNIFDNPQAGQQDYGGELLYPVIEWVSPR